MYLFNENSKTMKPKLNLKIFAKFFWGIATEKEKEHVYKSQESAQMLEKQWENGAGMTTADKSEKDEMLHKIRENKSLDKGLVRSINQRLMRVAAVLILLIAVGSVLYIFTDIDKKLQFNKITYIEKVNPKGQRSKIILPDNSVVWLNADSKIQYAEDFLKQEKRLLKLTGEAYFDVSHNPKKPFTIQIDEINVNVLGTRFNVRAYPEYSNIQTTLLQGRVSLLNKSNNQVSYLEPGDMGVYQKEGKSILVRRQVDVDKMIAWKEGKLIFDNDPFTYIAAELERWYDIDIKIDEDLKGKYRYTMTITDESIQEVCNLIQETTPVDVRITEDQVYILTQK